MRKKRLLPWAAKACPLLLLLLLASLFSLPLFSQTTTGIITGRVSDSKTGEAIPGASVKVKGSSKGSATDVTGSFKIEAASNATLIVSAAGYAEIQVSAKGSLSNIRLVQTTKDLDDVVVVGYGTQKKATLTGSISTVNAKTFQDRGPLSNPIAALQGQVPGVTVTRSSGQPGRENWNFQIRGATSTNGQNPLIIIDGVLINDNSTLNSLNPDDIDNISFLKDAAAAIYGARAAFGVVLITTKKAKAGGPVIQYDVSVSKKITALLPHLLNIRQWGQGLMQAQINDNYGITPPATNVWYQEGVFAANPPDSGYIDITALPGYTGSAVAGLLYNGKQVPTFGDVKDLTYFDTDMQSILWGNAVSTQHSLSFSGRNEKSGYRLSLGYLNDGSQLRWGLNGDQRYTISLNHDYQLTKGIKLETNISLQKNDIQQPTMLTNGGYSALSNFSQPGIPVFSKNGAPYEWGTVYSAPGQLTLGGDNKEYNTRVLANSNLTIKLAKHLNFVGTAGYNYFSQDTKTQQKQIQYYSYSGLIKINTFPTDGNLTTGNGSYYYRQTVTDPYYNLIGRFEYKNTFNKAHDVSIMAGGSYERDEYDLFGTRTFALASGNTPSLGLGVANTSAGYVTNAETQNHYALSSFFSRATYGYKGKYLLELLGRYDGSSKFVEDKRWKAFYGISGAWRISEEAFMKNKTFVNDLKIRASFGQVGNQGGIGLYDYIQLLNANSNQALLGQSTAVSVTTQSTLVSTSRTWETIENKNIGVDFSLLKSRLTGSFEYFWKENKNMLLGQTYPGILGATAPALNIGQLKTWGWEAVLAWRDKIGRDLTYNISVNVADNQNKLVRYGGANVLAAGFNSTVEGYSLNSYFGLQYDGRLQTQKQVDDYNAKYAPTASTNNINLPVPTALASPAGQVSGLRPGDNTFKDVNGDGKLSTGTSTLNPGDLVYLGKDDARYSFGVNLGVQWKGFDLGAIFQGVGKRAIFRSSNWRVPYGTVFQGQSNAWWGNTWTADNPNAFFPNLHSNGNSQINTYNYQASTWSVENGAYIRLKNLVIGYTLSQNILGHVSWLKGIQRLRFYFSGSDLWESTHIHDGWDPETTRTVSGNERYPFYRYLTCGANITF